MTAWCGMYAKAGCWMSLTDQGYRFTVMSMEIQDLQGIELSYLLYPLEECGILAESWLAQAHSVFSQLGIHEDDWEDYGKFLVLSCLTRLLTWPRYTWQLHSSA